MNHEKNVTLANRIRESMQATHDEIERLPIACAMADGSILKVDYVSLLTQLLHLHIAFESSLVERHGENALVTSNCYRAPVIRRDLESLDAKETDWNSAWESTQSVIDQISCWSKNSPISLLGMLYILEGSRMGSMVLAKSLAKALAVPMGLGVGLDYHVEGIDHRPQTWMRFKHAFSAIPFSENDQALIIESASETMSGLFKIYQEASITLANSSTFLHSQLT